MEQRCLSCMQMIEGDNCPYCGYPSRITNESHQLAVGTMLRKRYQIGRVLGQGGFGITYLGWDTLMRRTVAVKEFYPTFDSIVGQTVSKGFKFTHGDKLWQVIQQSMTVQAHYPPGVGTESLYAEVCESHEGTEDDPIPYEGNMALEEGKCYVQEYEVFRCVRDTGNPVYHPLRELLGLYVEEVTA